MEVSQPVAIFWLMMHDLLQNNGQSNMKYIELILVIVLLSILQPVTNNYLPYYMSPDLLLILTVYVACFYRYYTGLSAVLLIAYISHVLSAGDVWFYLFLYIVMFYVTYLIKHIFDIKRFITIATLVLSITVLKPFIVLVVTSLSGSAASIFYANVGIAVKQLIPNVVISYIIYKLLPYMLKDFDFNAESFN